MKQDVRRTAYPIATSSKPTGFFDNHLGEEF
jgi:hypothetical protein